MIKYTQQFKLTAIQAFLERGYGFRHIAGRFQIDPSLLRRWVQAYRIHGAASLQKRIEHLTPEFKLTVLERMWREKLSLRQTAAIFNLGNSTQIATWQSQYYSGATNALAAVKKGSRPVMPKPIKPTANCAETKAVNDEDLSHAELLDKLRWVQAENAVLKKLKALREEKARLKKVEKRKPG